MEAILSKHDIENGILAFIEIHNEVDFEQIVLSAQKHFSTQESLKILTEFCLRAERLDDVKCAFEYTAIHNLIPQLEHLCEQHQFDDQFYEYVNVYRLAHRMAGEPTNHSFLKEAQQLHRETEDETLLFKIELMILYFHTMNGYNTIVNQADELRNKLQKMKPGYLKTAFAARLTTFLSYYYFYSTDDFASAEGYCLANTVNPAAPPIFKASAYHSLGLLYSFKSLKDSLRNLELSCKHFELAGMKEKSDILKKFDIPFILNLHAAHYEPYNRLIEGADSLEKAHYHIISKSPEKALPLLERLLAEEPDDFFAKLYYYYAKRDVYSITQQLLTLERNAHELRVIRFILRALIPRQAL
ncbi:AimR family lysis-lysogeny pheromone receptor [Shouchella sp. JSM 1781072]|uniref:AimR family lysis-lysogeny pheromone receptor n=1 Tax=Shouchella sp. JSM 1781072 TaxID=3344581 RepID=UPI0035C1E491